jgi:hypothetical protein
MRTKISRIIIFLFIAALFSALFYPAAEAKIRTLRLKTFFTSNEKGKSSKIIVENMMIEEIIRLGDIEIVDEKENYDVHVHVDQMVAGTGLGRSYVTLDVAVVRPGDDVKRALYKDSRTGTLRELSRLARSLVEGLDADFLEGKYLKREVDLSDKVRRSVEDSIARAKARRTKIVRRARLKSEFAPVPAPAKADADKELIRSMAEKMKQKGVMKRHLTEAEIDFASRHSEHAPRIAEITYYAEMKAKREHARDSRVPEDAYRHVLWAYLLAKEFGADLAREITATHEVGSTGNTRAEKMMDMHNNSIGIGYAQMGYSEEEVLRYVMTDPAIMRSPGK